MKRYLTSLFVFSLFLILGYSLHPWELSRWEGMGLGAVLGLGALYLERRIPQMSLNVVLGGWVGIMCGALVAFLINKAIATSTPTYRHHIEFVYVATLLFMGYLGLRIGAHFGQWLDSNTIKALFGDKTPSTINKILDTSVIIDGRIADVTEAGFIEGDIIVPQFVLRELQHIADSADSIKRTRGRKGLDLLQRMKKNKNINVVIMEADFPEIREVDLKLIELATRLGAKVITNDFNLNKVARLRGVDILNVNELANALKPIVLPGELMEIFILKEGKERTQGVGYLDDGTMVVVDDGRRYIGQTISITVTSVLQTTAGKMIFGEAAGSGESRSHADSASGHGGGRSEPPHYRERGGYRA
jgi:uncharacterized protein YacL